MKLLVLTIGCFGALVANATDLDRPIEPARPTIRSEIYRGVDAASECSVKIDRLQACVFRIQTANTQRNTGTDAFNAGLHFGAWLRAAIEDRVDPGSNGAVAGQLFRTLKQLETKLRIDDHDVCEAAGRVSCSNVLPMMADWSAKVR